MKRSWLLLALAILTSAPSASAQNAAARADHTFVVSGAPGVGLFWRHSRATDLGIFVSGSVLSRDDRSAANLDVRPTLRRYWATTERLTPYTDVAVIGSLVRQRIDSQGLGGSIKDRTLGLGLEAALGVEWFPIERVSVGGHAGLRVDHQWIRERMPTFDGGVDEQNQGQTSVSTFVSGLQVRFYF